MKGNILAASAIVLGAAAEVSGVRNEIFSLVKFPPSKMSGGSTTLGQYYVDGLTTRP
jgi:hypothetical protein